MTKLLHSKEGNPFWGKGGPGARWGGSTKKLKKEESPGPQKIFDRGKTKGQKPERSSAYKKRQ